MVRKACIFGAGNVVAHRLLPALERMDLFDTLYIYYKGYSELLEPQYYSIDTHIYNIESDISYESAVRKTASEDYPIFISTPPGPRLRLLNSLARKCRPIIIEKPIYTSRIDDLKFENNPLFEESFCLSYYTLEKALGWSALFRPNDIYNSLLDIEPNELENVLEVVPKSLGKLNKLTIKIQESNEHSPKIGQMSWLNNDPYGIFFDMGVHVFSLAEKVICLKNSLAHVSFSTQLKKDLFIQFFMNGVVNNIKLDFAFGKFFSETDRKRYLRAEFANGSVYCNFDKMTTDIICPIGDYSISHKDLLGKYDTQLKMVRNYLNIVKYGNWKNVRYDDLSGQIKAIRNLLNLKQDLK